MISSASVLRAWLAHVQNTSARSASAEVFAGYVSHIQATSLKYDAKSPPEVTSTLVNDIRIVTSDQ